MWPCPAYLQSPIGLPTSSSIRVMVGYVDGSLRDMSNDPRTQLRLLQGSDLCTISPASKGARGGGVSLR